MMQIIIIGVFLIAPVILSITAFRGGVSFAYYTMIVKMRKLNDKIVNDGDIAMLAELNQFLESISPENSEPTFFDWFSFGFLGPKDKKK